MEEQMEEQKEQTKVESVLENANKWYGFYHKLPKIIFIITVIGFFIWGIVDPAVFHYENYYEDFYGVMRLESAGAVWFIWQLIGWVTAAINYLILKLALSPIIVQIECLKEIKENTKK